jgi:hypothetical protein
MSRAPEDEIHEFVLLEFQPAVSLVEQLETMRRLDAMVAELDGFRAREYFYSAEQRRWLDHIVWADRGSAERSEQLASEPGAAQLFQRMSSIIAGRYRRVDEG